MKQIVFFVVFMILSILTLTGQNSPSLINYQGFLTDSEDIQVNGIHALFFRIYETEQSTDILWEESKILEIVDGYFHTQLGSVNPLDQNIFSEPDRWLGIAVDVDTEMQPRIHFASVAYAMNVPTEMNDDDWLMTNNVMYAGDSGIDVAIGSTSAQGYKLCVYGVSAAHSHVGFSDKRFKTNIEHIENPINILNKLNGVSYNWKNSEYPSMGFDDKKHHGVIAQELQKHMHGAVFQGSDGYLSVAYDEIIPILIECIKAQQLEIEKLKKSINNI